MKGYTVLYFDHDILITPEKILRELKGIPKDLEVIIKNNRTGWQSPKIPVTLIIREGKNQIESLENEWTKGGILTFHSFKMGNVSKLLFDNKNFSPSIICRIEKLLLPPKDNKSTKKHVNRFRETFFNIKPLVVLNINELNLNFYIKDETKRKK